MVRKALKRKTLLVRARLSVTPRKGRGSRKRSLAGGFLLPDQNTALMVQKILREAYARLTKPLRRGWGLGRFRLVQNLNSLIYVSLKDPGGVTEAGGFKVHLDPQDAMGLSVFHEYKPLFTKLCKERIKNDSVVVDIGAFIGYFTLVFSKLADKVYAFEPDPGNMALIRRNLAANNCQNVICEQQAIGEATGTIPLYLVQEGNTGDQRTMFVPGRKAIDVPMTTLDEYFKDAKVDFIKMDMQGYEHMALLGASKLFAANPQIELFVKLTPALLKEQGLKSSDEFNLLKRYGFQVWSIDEAQKQIVPIEAADDESGTTLNLWARRHAA
jgi:FkbM family methyltransferase